MASKNESLLILSPTPTPPFFLKMKVFQSTEPGAAVWDPGEKRQGVGQAVLTLHASLLSCVMLHRGILRINFSYINSLKNIYSKKPKPKQTNKVTAFSWQNPKVNILQ